MVSRKYSNSLTAGILLYCLSITISVAGAALPLDFDWTGHGFLATLVGVAGLCFLSKSFIERLLGKRGCRPKNVWYYIMSVGFYVALTVVLAVFNRCLCSLGQLKAAIIVGAGFFCPLFILGRSRRASSGGTAPKQGLESLKELISFHGDIDTSAITLDTELKSLSWGFDNIGFLELLGDIEDRFQISLSNKSIAAIRTVRDLLDIIEGREA